MKAVATKNPRPPRVRVAREKWPPPRSPLSSKHFRAGGHDDIAGIMSLMRGDGIAKLDAMYAGWLGELLWRDHRDPAIRAKGLEIFQAIQMGFFPEEFAEPGDTYEPGLFPAAGPRRVGSDRLKRYGELLQDAAG